MFCSNLPFSGWHKMYYNRFSLLLNPVRKHTREKGTKQTAANLEKGKWIWEIFPRQNCIASVGKRWREAEDGYFEIFTWEPGDVIVINRLWSKWEGSVSSSLLRVQPVLGPLNNTLLLVVYNHCKYRNASSSCCAFFLCYLKKVIRLVFMASQGTQTGLLWSNSWSVLEFCQRQMWNWAVLTNVSSYILFLFH